jgi:protein disulfide-isomerase A6
MLVPFHALFTLVFPKGSSKKEPVSYEKGRSEKDLVDFLNEKAGKHRLVGGALNDKAGRIVDLDELAKKLAAATTKAEESFVYTELEQALSKLTSTFHS